MFKKKVQQVSKLIFKPKKKNYNKKKINLEEKWVVQLVQQEIRRPSKGQKI